MIRSRRGYTVLSGIVILVLSILVITGCTTVAPTTGGSTSQTDEKDKGPVPLYYDFGDVLVPHELKLEKKTSFVFRSPGLAAGVLVFKGRIEINSLIAFFENNMAKDNWKPVSSFRSPRTMMLYQKENRWCVISIVESDFSIRVEIWVAPTAGGAGGGLLK